MFLQEWNTTKNISNIWECFSYLKSSLVKNSPFLQCQCIQNQNLVLRSSKFWLIFAQKFDIAKARTFDEEIAKICKRLKSQDDILSYLQDSTANSACLAVLFCPVLVCLEKAIIIIQCLEYSDKFLHQAWKIVSNVKTFLVYHSSKNIPWPLYTKNSSNCQWVKNYSM